MRTAACTNSVVFGVRIVNAGAGDYSPPLVNKTARESGPVKKANLEIRRRVETDANSRKRLLGGYASRLGTKTAHFFLQKTSRK